MAETRQTFWATLLYPVYALKNYIRREFIRYQFKKEMKSFYKTEQYKKIMVETANKNG